ncbi:uncharacterized protein [Henckelia pumila]|uniref:uncharacterized protein n=1 Tax=Henckelia pumila TaxID=405737 RepID=UPI003C6E3ACC
MAGHGDESSHDSVGRRWSDQDDRGHRGGLHHHRHDDHRSFSMNRFMQMGLQPLVGGDSPEDAGNWLRRMEVCFREFRCTEVQQVDTLDFLVEGRAWKWWYSASAPFISAPGVATWDKFRTTFHKLYFPPALRQAKASELLRRIRVLADIVEGIILPTGAGRFHGHVSDTERFDHLNKDCPQSEGAGSGSGSGSQASVHQRPKGQLTGGSNLKPRASIQVFVLKHDQTVDENENDIADTMVVVSTPTGQSTTAKSLVLGCPLEFEGNVLIVNLMILAMEDFDCILGIDVLNTYRDSVGCYQRLFVELWSLARKATAVDTFAKNVGIENIPVVNEFPDVFSYEIPWFPSVHEVKFDIDLMPRTSPIFSSTVSSSSVRDA